MGLRFAVGVAEGFLQGGFLFLSMIYTPRELALRISICYTASVLGGSFNGLISYGIEKNLSDVHGWAAWQWIFLVEGVLPCAWAFVVFVFLPSTPEKKHFMFTDEEQSMLIARSRAGHNTGHSIFQPRIILEVLKDPTFWLFVGMRGGLDFAQSGIGFFVPVIIKGLGFSSLHAQAFSVIPYAIASVFTISAAFLSDRLGQRGYFMAGGAFISSLGFLLTIVVPNVPGRFVGLCIAMSGMYPTAVACIAWLQNINIGRELLPVLLILHWCKLTLSREDMYRATAFGLASSLGEAVAIPASQAFNDPPRYRNGLGATLAFMAATGLMALVLRWRLVKLNKRKLEEKDAYPGNSTGDSDIDIIGNKHPDFHFIL
jgi:hypothetical protein